MQLAKHISPDGNDNDGGGTTPTNTPTPRTKKYYSDDELCELFDVSKSMTRRWREMGLIEYLRAPGATTIRYSRDQIAAFEKRLTQRAKGRRK